MLRNTWDRKIFEVDKIAAEAFGGGGGGCFRHSDGLGKQEKKNVENGIFVVFFIIIYH